MNDIERTTPPETDLSTLAPPPASGNEAPESAGEAPAIPLAETAPAPPAPSYAANWPTVSRTLKFPIPDGKGGWIAKITVAEPDIETMERILVLFETAGIKEDAGFDVWQFRPLLAAMTGIDPAVLARLNFRDARALMEDTAPLLEGLTS